MKKLSQDQMVKNLIRDYPVDALEFFEPDIVRVYGRPVSVSFVMQEIKKHSHYDINMKNDIAVVYSFAGGKKLVLLLIEHWSDKSKFDIYRLAHYLIDIAGRYPEAEILPVAFFTDRADHWKKPPPSEIIISCAGKNYLEFRYKLIRLKEHQAEKYYAGKNRFITVMRSGMRFQPEKKISLAVEILESYYYIEMDKKIFEKNTDIIEYFLAIKDEEKEIIIESLESADREETVTIVQELMKRGWDKGLNQGIEQTVLSMRMNGLSYAMVQKITGLSREKIKEIEKNK
jgi:hypothetical protein